MPTTIAALVASIPSPSSGALHLGPLQLRAYGLCIALGVLAAVWLAGRRLEARGGRADDITAIAVWAVPAGVLGARLYHVITDWQRFEDQPFDAVKIWQGGLGIWGGIAAGSIAGVVVARRRGLGMGMVLDVAAPALPLAQAIGRLGNWFNQELFGRPTDVPWALEIDPSHRPSGYEDQATFHPTFLYELLWNLAVVGFLLWVDRRWKLKPGKLFGLYVAGYTLGRFFIERVRIDPANEIAGLRVNEWVSAIVFLLAVAFVVWGGVRAPATAEVVAEEAGPDDPFVEEVVSEPGAPRGGEPEDDEAHEEEPAERPSGSAPTVDVMSAPGRTGRPGAPLGALESLGALADLP